MTHNAKVLMSIIAVAGMVFFVIALLTGLPVFWFLSGAYLMAFIALWLIQMMRMSHE